MRFILHILLLMLSTSVLGQQYYLFIGTYTGTGSKGIYVYRFNSQTGALQPVSSTENVSNPSFLALHPSGKYLYACNENSPGTASAFSFDRSSGRLTFINQQPTGGDHPAYVSVHKDGKWLLTGNYTGGSVTAFPIDNNGSLQPYAQLVQHTGKSINEQRQEKPHVHATVFAPDHDHLYVPDLGIDKVMVYKFNERDGLPLESKEDFAATSSSGSGPRHFTFHPSGKYAYLMEELTGTVVAYKFSGRKLKGLQRIPSHAEGSKGPFGSADIHVSPDGRFLYASNRGAENNIAIFSINQREGILRTVGYQSTLGEHPRNFMIDPTGKFLLVANRDTNNIVVFRRDSKTGLLKSTGVQVTIPKPVCLVMLP